MTIRGLALLALAAIAGCSTTTRNAPAYAGPSAVEAAARTITAADIHGRIAFLASDELRGRDTPSPGLERAAAYIAGELEGMGLEPAGDDGSFLQRWPYSSVALRTEDVAIAATIGGRTHTFAFGTDLFALPSARDEVTGTPVFLGPVSGVAARAEAARGQVAIVSMQGPPNMTMLRAAGSLMQAGATGVVLVLGPQVGEPVIGQLARRLSAAPMQDVPILGLRHDRARALFEDAGLDPSVLATGTDAPQRLEGATLTLRVPAQRGTNRVPNVVALLPGSDPELRDTYIIYTAHFDHLGVGSPDETGDSIYNGADDDASGTSVVLEVAEAFAALPTPPGRSILFLLVSGEEKGLLGSAYYADHPTVELDRVVANINMDMVGRNAPDTVVAIGQEYTSLGPLAHRIAAEHGLGLTLAGDPDPTERVFFRSDHVNFVRHEIPAIFFTTWLHPQYHRPGDEVDLIDTDKTARIAKLVFHLGHAVATTAEPPHWTPEGIAEVREMLAGR